MLKEALDFRDESDALYDLLSPQDDRVFARQTLFKGWTVNDVLTHLHIWNWAANATLNDDPEFGEMVAAALSATRKGEMRRFETQRYAGLTDRAMLNAWRAGAWDVADNFHQADPKQRLKWAGPDMSARSAITARLMETWAHGQAIFDLLGVPRQSADRIKSIVYLGVNTFGWSFQVQGQEIPETMPSLRLTAPSGDVWEWNEGEGGDNRISGSAEEFCQVVTQTRNIADTSLEVIGDTAKRWMAAAQCFAGPPESPPATGTRHRA
jgi:uncharacterized protein (TIGR03084 family)